MKKLNVSDIRIDGGTQIRKQLNQDKVDEYAAQMMDGEVFPPITVFFDGSSYWLASGFHRYFATKKINNETIDVDVKQGTIEEATLFALGDNKHGLNMTAEDYRRSVEIMLGHPVWSNWSNAQIARHIGVSAMTVGRVKKEKEPVKSKEPTTYVDKHGKESKMDTTNIGKKPKNKPKDKPKPADNPQPTGEPDDYDEDEEKIRELCHTIEQLAEENTILRDKIAIGQWNASEIEKIDIEETVTNLREQLRVLEIDNKALRESRDMYQNRHAEAVKIINSMKRKEKK